MKKRTNLPGLTCPHCDGRCVARNSEGVTPLVRNLRYHCDDCGHIFAAQLAILHSLWPSAAPRDGLRLTVRAGFRPANDVALPPAAANDLDERREA